MLAFYTEINQLRHPVYKIYIENLFKLRQYQCGVCGMSFTTPGSVRRHMATHQVRITLGVCGMCGMFFTTPGSVQRHRATHQVGIPVSVWSVRHVIYHTG